VHINNALLAGDSSNEIAEAKIGSQKGLKHNHAMTTYGDSTDGDSTDSEEESLSLSIVINQLHRKFPQLNLPQYLHLLEKQGILYAESAVGFDEEYFISLGIVEGAVKPLLSGIQKAWAREKRLKKCAKVVDKENYSRAESVEV
jgi:hypothetical protein